MIEEHIPFAELKTSGGVFKSPLRSLSFEEDEPFAISEFKESLRPHGKSMNAWSTENLLLDTNENHVNPDIPTISCHTVLKALF